MKLDDEMLEKLKRENEVDNSRYEELMSNFFNLTTDEKIEYAQLFRNLRVFLPVIIKGNSFEGNENAEKGEILQTKEPVSFDINYLSNENGNSVPIFTSEEKMEESGFSSSTYVLYMKDLAEMLKQSDKYSFITINPFTQFGLDQPIDLFLKLIDNPNLEDDITNPLKTVLKMLKERSIELRESNVFYIKGGINFMMDNAVNGVYTHPDPLNASSTKNFLKEYDYLNIILMPKSKKFLFTGEMLEKNHFDILLAPETEFEFVDELDEFTTVWKVGDQPFYNDNSNDEIKRLKHIVSGHISNSEFDKTISYLNELVAIDPSDLSNWETKGYCHYEIGQYGDAIECFNTVLESDPYREQSWYLKCIMLNNLNRWEESLECLDKAIELNPEKGDFWHMKASVLEELDRFDESFECLNKAIELNPTSPELLIEKGNLLSYLGRFDEAIECFDEAIFLNPSDAYSFELTADLYSYLENYKEAIKYYKEAIKLDPKNSTVWNNLGDAYLNTKEFEKGLDCCEKALSLDSNNFNAWFTAGEIYYELEEYDKAMDYAMKAKEIDSTDSELLDFIEKIKNM